MKMSDPAISASSRAALPDSPEPGAFFGPASPLDPQIADFMQRMAKDASRYPRRDTIGVAQGREIAERVRAPWAQQGPAMASTTERLAPTRHGEVRIRIHTPTTRRSPAALLYIHGGGFVVFSIDTHDRVMREYAERAGIVVIGIDYTRAPEGRFPQPLDECVDTLCWLMDHAATLGIEADSLFVGGDSAGANLSVGACMALRDRGRTLRGMLLNYGCYSTALTGRSAVRYGAGEYGLSLHMMVWFYMMYLGEQLELADARMCLLDADLQGLPPALMVVAECDPLADQNTAMAARLRAAQVAVQDTIYPGTVHSFLEAVEVAEVAARAFDDSAAWIHARLVR